MAIPPIAQPSSLSPDVDVVIDTDGIESPPEVDADGASISLPDGDGSVTIDLDPLEPEVGPTKHEDNLAESLSVAVLGSISTALLDAIEEDDQDRREWLDQRAAGIDLLGLKIERQRGGVGNSSAPLDGMSVVRDPILLEAVLRFQANAFGELCPADGPVKVRNFGENNTVNDMLADEMEKDLNFYLTSGVDGTATEYAEDTRKMLFWTGFASGMFKKVYMCPLRRRPVSESVDGANLIVPSTATDLRNAGRITHQVNMRQSTMKRMQLAGVYRDVALRAPTPTPNAMNRKEADVQGLRAESQRPEDQTYTVYECYCELDIPGFEHKEDGKETGLPLPYRVTIDKDSREVLEIRRNWEEEDEDYKAQIPFVAFNYVTGFGVYGMGLLHILGNVTSALTSILRETIDSGMFANFPGFLFAKQLGRQLQNEFRVPPGGGAPIDIGMMGSIRDAVMPLPYKDISPQMLALMDQLRTVGQRVGGSSEVPVGEGRQDAPVGTTLAMIEQATKIEGGVHKALFAAQAQELALLRKLIKKDPESIFRGNSHPAMGFDPQVRLAKFKVAIENATLAPRADPNTPSHMHRVMKALAIKQLQAANPNLYNPIAVDMRILSMIHVDQPSDLFAPPVPPQQGPDPAMLAKMAEFYLKNRDLALKEAKLRIDAVEKGKDRKSKETLAVLQLAERLATHPEADQVVDDQIMQLAPLMSPSATGDVSPASGEQGGGAGAGTPVARADGGQVGMQSAPTAFSSSYVPNPEPAEPEDEDSPLGAALLALRLAREVREMDERRQPLRVTPMAGPGSFYYPFQRREWGQ